MSKLFRTREGDITAVDTKTQLTTLGSETAPGPLLVPAGAKKLNAIIVAASSNYAVAGAGTFICRLEGGGLEDGPETCVVGAAGVGVATGGASATNSRRIQLDLDVVPANEIIIFGENAGTDVGTTSMAVTLEFQL